MAHRQAPEWSLEPTGVVEVQSYYRGVALGARQLSIAPAGRPRRSPRALAVGGGALLAAAFALFAVAYVDSGRERAARARHLEGGGSGRAFVWRALPAVVDWAALGAVGLGAALVGFALRRRNGGGGRYVIGAAPGSDAPVDPGCIDGADAFTLVERVRGDLVVSLAPAMTGEIACDGGVVPLRAWIGEMGDSFVLPDRAIARVACGEATFLLRPIDPPPQVRPPLLRWRWEEQKYLVGTAVGMALVMGMVAMVPPDPGWGTDRRRRFIAVVAGRPEGPTGRFPRPRSGSGSVEDRHASTDQLEGRALRQAPDQQGGRRRPSEPRHGHPGARGVMMLHPRGAPTPDPADPSIAALRAEAIRNAGILGVLRGAAAGAVLDRGGALGDGGEALAQLEGPALAEAYGVGALGLVGTGAGGGGQGEGTLGIAAYDTMGRGGAAFGGSGSGYGRGAGGLGGRRVRNPDVLIAAANVRGALDPAIIRRIVRRHLNEVRYCYEQELPRAPALQGRIAVSFVIAPSGLVSAATLQESSMQSAPVESCVVAAVRRWEFPKPTGGGLVIVHYPFVFTSGGQGE